jgi:hypothetical protein
MNQRLLAGLLTIGAAACGGPSSNATTTPTTAATTTTPPPTAPSESDQPCGYDILASGKGGACLEPAVFGAERTSRCEAFLLQHGWQREIAEAEAAISQQMGKAMECFRAP